MMWHPFTQATLVELGFKPALENADMVRGNWRIRPEKDHVEGNDRLQQYPLTLEHDLRGVVLKFLEPAMLDLLRYLG